MCRSGHLPQRGALLVICSRTAALVFVLVLTASARPADDPKPEPRNDQRVDADGDPLPPLAVARLGTTRWRQPLDIATLAFSQSGKKVIATGALGQGCCVCDVSSGRSLVWSPDYDGVEAAVVM